MNTSQGHKIRAIVQDGYGSSDGLRSGEIDRPEISAHEVLVEVAAAGMDHWHTSAPREDDPDVIPGDLTTIRRLPRVTGHGCRCGVST